MNTKLVDSLVQIIESLTPEEQDLLQEKLKLKKNQHPGQKQITSLQEIRSQIFARRGGKPLEPSPEEIIDQMREERTEDIMRASFPDLYEKQLDPLHYTF